MKHLICLLLAFIQLDGFSQIADTSQPLREYNWSGMRPVIKPDTLRAICLITTHPNGIARTRMGFVIIAQGKRPVYLECRKRALKLPQVGWGYQIMNQNIKPK